MRQTTITGSSWVFGDDMNTDVIHAPDYFSLDEARVRLGLFQRLDPSIQQRLQPGDILVGGRNFGCGSSRETVIRSLKLNQVGAIVGRSVHPQHLAGWRPAGDDRAVTCVLITTSPS
jgi:3-isopropylmalate dehydratase small subunit